MLKEKKETENKKKLQNKINTNLHVMFTIENPIKIKFECQLTYLRCLCCALLLYVAYLFVVCVVLTRFFLNIEHQFQSMFVFISESNSIWGFFVTLNSIN